MSNIAELRHVQSENELDITAKNQQIDVQSKEPEKTCDWT